MSPDNKSSDNTDISEIHISEICIVACAEAFRGDGEILCNPIGTIPVLGGRLARATFEPYLAYTDTVSVLQTGNYPVSGASNAVAKSGGGKSASDKTVAESYVPYRTMFDIVWSGRRHVMMGATQIDMWGNQNIAAIGDWQKPKAQLLGLRGAPGNVINHTCSYWVPNHSPKTFVEKVDVVSGPGYDRLKELGSSQGRFSEIRRVISNLGVFDFETPDKRMRVRSLHPGVSLDEVVEATGFDLALPESAAPEGVPETRPPSEEDLHIIREVLDPGGIRKKEVT